MLYLTGSPIRQDYLQTALSWISKGNIEQYMADHQKDPNANALWAYFSSVMTWVKQTFTVYRKEMKGLNWGAFYDEFGAAVYDTHKIEEETARLMADDDVTNKKGVYAYILTQNEKHLNIRIFTDAQKRAVYEKQSGNCAKCGKAVKYPETEADHITPWSKGGKTAPENCQMLCKACHRTKTDV